MVPMVTECYLNTIFVAHRLPGPLSPNHLAKDTVSLPLVIHPQNIRLLKGPLYHKSLLLIRLLQLSYKLSRSREILMRAEQLGIVNVLAEHYWVRLHRVGEQSLLTTTHLRPPAHPFSAILSYI